MKQPHIVTGMYLAEGFYGEKRRRKGEPERYQEMSDKFGGDVEIRTELAAYAEVFTDFFLDPEQFALDWPGVLHYELTEPLGQWLFDHLDDSPSRFVEEFTDRFKQWTTPLTKEET